MTYPAKRIIRLMDVHGREQPAFAPLEEVDHLKAYAPFLYETMEAAEADQAGDVEELGAAREEERKALIADGDYDEEEDEADNFFEEDNLIECTVHADGSIETQFATFERSTIFSAFGVADPAAPAPGR